MKESVEEDVAVDHGSFTSDHPAHDSATPKIQRFGDYELLEEIARGGMGIVYRARQFSLDRIVAVKLLPFGTLTNAEFIKRFRVEASAAAALRHPNIVSVHEVGVHQGQHYLVMNFVNGPSLGHLVADGPLPARRAATYLKVVAEAVQYAHEKGILHRDLKPSNVLIDADDQPLVTDFGLAKRLDGESSLTITGQALGSPGYMPPEQALAEHSKVTRRSDVYGLGAMLYHLITARPPFQASTLQEAIRQVAEFEPASPRLLNPSVPRDLETICLKCLEKEPERRYGTARELAEDLGRFLNDEPIRARPVGVMGRTWRWSRRRPALASVCLALIITFIAGISGILWQWNRAIEAEQLALQERNQAEFLAAQSALEIGQSKLEAGNNRGLLDLVQAYELAKHDPAFQHSIGRRWSIWNEKWDRHMVLGRSWIGIPSPDHLQFATISDASIFNTSKAVDLRDMLTDEHIAGPLMHDSIIQSGAYRPDGQVFATVTETGRIYLWNSRTGAPIGSPYETGISGLNQLTFSEDGRLLVAISLDDIAEFAVLRLQDPERPIHILNHRYPIGTARFSPDGEILATLGRPELQLWRTSNFEPAGPPIKAEDYFSFSKDGALLAFGAPDSDLINLLEVQTQAILKDFPEGPGGASDVVFSHDGRIMASFGWDANLRLWRLDSDSGPYVTKRLGLRIGSPPSFSPDDSWVAVADADGAVYVLRTSDGSILYELQTGLYTKAYFLKSGVLVTRTGGAPIFWDLGTSPMPGSILPHDALAHSLAFDGSGTFLATGSEDELRLWRMQEPPLLERTVPMPGRVASVVFVEGQDQFTAFTDDGSLLAVEPDTGATSVVNRFDRGFELAASLSPDARQLALFHFRQGIIVDTVTGFIQEIDIDGGFLSVDFRPDSSVMAVGRARWQIDLYDVGPETITLTGSSELTGGWNESVAWHPGGEFLAVNVENNSIRFLELSGNRLIFEAYPSTLASIGLLRFSPDGSLLAAAGSRQDGGFGTEIWHFDTQRGLQRSGSVLPSEHSIWSLAFSPDSQSLVVGGQGATRIWKLPQAPTGLDEMRSRTEATLGIRTDASGNTNPEKHPIDDVETVRARLTEQPTSNNNTLDAALELPLEKALIALQILADEHPEAGVYRRLLGRVNADLMVEKAVKKDWEQALAHGSEAIRLGFDAPFVHFQRALVLLAMGDLENYRLGAQSLVDQYSTSSDPGIVRLVAAAVGLHPAALDDYSQLVEQVQRAQSLAGGSYGTEYRIYLGVVLMRAKRYEEAVVEFETVDRFLRSTGASVNFSPTFNRCLMAISLAHLGHEDTAREWFGHALSDIQNRSPAERFWHYELIDQLLIDEAEAALNNRFP